MAGTTVAKVGAPRFAFVASILTGPHIRFSALQVPPSHDSVVDHGRVVQRTDNHASRFPGQKN